MRWDLHAALRLYWVLSPPGEHEAQPFFERLDQALTYGVSMVQWRDKTGKASASLAAKTLKICRTHDVPFVINDDIQLCGQIGADGVHLGQDDDSPALARQALGSSAIIGLSVGSDAEAENYDPSAVDYVGVGPLFTTATKADAGEALGWMAANALIDRCQLHPAVLIGGITANALSQLNWAQTSKNLKGVAVVSALSGSTDIAKAAKELDSSLPLFSTHSDPIV